MGTQNEILTDDESEVIKLLQYIPFEAEDFEDPENGGYLERMEALLAKTSELDATVVKIMLDRTHFFLGKIKESHFGGSCLYTVVPETSEATDRIKKALESVTIKSSDGFKNDLLEILDNLQIDYFYRDSENPDPEELHEINEIWHSHAVHAPVLKEFIQWNLLFPWNEFLGTVFSDVPEGHRLFAWNEECKVFNAL